MWGSLSFNPTVPPSHWGPHDVVQEGRELSKRKGRQPTMTTELLSLSLHRSSPPPSCRVRPETPAPSMTVGDCPRAWKTVCGPSPPQPERVSIICLLAAGAGHCLPQGSGVKGRATLSEQRAVGACSLGMRPWRAF